MTLMQASAGGEFAGRRVVVLGLGETGLSMAAWLAARGARLSVADTRSDPPARRALEATLPRAELRLGAFDDALFADAELIAISPGLSPALPAVARAAARGVPLAGDIELFARALRGGGSRAIAITGTNGKSTVTALAGALARAAGLDAEVAGNISPAALDALARREAAGRLPEAWVLELSSFQLETTHTLELDAATVLNVSEDHLDRHGSIAAYASAKARIFAHARVQLLNRDDPRSMAMARSGCEQLSFGLDEPRRHGDYGIARIDGRPWLVQGAGADRMPLLEAAELRIAGLHNAANALAALALARVLAPRPEALAPMLAALRAFGGLPHRVEPVGESGGVRWYDDSKGTNVGSTVAALDGLAGMLTAGGRVVLIAGGDGKGQDFAPLAPAVARAARCVVLIGRDGPAIGAALAGAANEAGVTLIAAADMAEAVAAAAAAARPGDAVLLSPACASFDMFRDYRHRAEVFRAAFQGTVHGR